MEEDYSARSAREYLLTLDYALQQGLAFRRTRKSHGCLIPFAFVVEFTWISFIEIIATVMTTLMVLGVSIKWLINMLGVFKHARNN